MAIVVDEAVFSPSYVPDKLPHRDEQLRQLHLLLSGWLQSPGQHYPRVTLVGRPGTGKTVTIRKLWEMYKERSKAKFIYINGFIFRNFTAIINEIARSLSIPFPRRGLSRDEFLALLIEHLRERDLYAFMVFDDAFNVSPDILSTFIRLGQEVDKLGAFRVALAVVGHSDTLLNNLDPSTRGIMGKYVIRFNPYTKDQIFDILLDRARMGLAEGSYSEEILQMISDITGAQSPLDAHKGDARLAIDILYRSAYIAQQSGRRQIMPEDVRKASKEVLFGVSEEVLIGLPLHEKLLLLAIVRTLKTLHTPYVTFGEAEETYKMICEEHGEKPRVHSQLWTYLNDLKEKGIIETRQNRKGEGVRGRTTLISIGTEPLDTLESVLIKIIREELK
ncbi:MULTISPECIES: ORC1-type DNA replication protein [Pyrobaculum]|uniref:ORC1-type DNA replication protein n=3 Tax=Pyrobaculum TaxID=2276 RepID=A4WGV5_PYRAR|nr:ORC1-type DNA replication protein [Pyrobaculum arsenaticum]ABP49622.1 AAA ATPase [Pyrobaculum arsenaticum DSM 13514]MCY0891062.1 ORC1-type DNA replication protein [Pyrobaculum arsenaticum]NYR15609.1 AAA family ATPase [Pyrobaculum arsenaticum]